MKQDEIERLAIKNWEPFPQEKEARRDGTEIKEHYDWLHEHAPEELEALIQETKQIGGPYWYIAPPIDQDLDFYIKWSRRNPLAAQQWASLLFCAKCRAERHPE